VSTTHRELNSRERGHRDDGDAESRPRAVGLAEGRPRLGAAGAARLLRTAGGFGAVFGFSAVALAAGVVGEPEQAVVERVEAQQPAQAEAPVVALTHSARAPATLGYGASAFGSGTFALSGEVRNETQLGGGLRLWGSPIESLVLLAEAQRRDNGELAPALALQVRFWQDERWAFGALGRFKSEGFAEIEGELELGLLGSYDAGASHLDLNAVVGRGFDEAETDAELALRLGRDVFGWLRAGVESRLRYRLTGDALLPGGRKWDAIGGPQLSASFDHFFASLLTGPSSVGVVSGLGWESLLTFGGVL